jgi:hypothetical protein
MLSLHVLGMTMVADLKKTRWSKASKRAWELSVKSFCKEEKIDHEALYWQKGWLIGAGELLWNYSLSAKVTLAFGSDLSGRRRENFKLIFKTTKSYIIDHLSNILGVAAKEVAKQTILMLDEIDIQISFKRYIWKTKDSLWA